MTATLTPRLHPAPAPNTRRIGDTCDAARAILDLASGYGPQSVCTTNPTIFTILARDLDHRIRHNFDHAVKVLPEPVQHKVTSHLHQALTALDAADLYDGPLAEGFIDGQFADEAILTYLDATLGHLNDAYQAASRLGEVTL